MLKAAGSRIKTQELLAFSLRPLALLSELFDEDLGAPLIVVERKLAFRQRGHGRRLEAALGEPLRSARRQHEKPLEFVLPRLRFDRVQ